LKFSQDAVKNYKRISDLVWFGTMYRLESPYEGNRAVLMFSNEEKTRAILFNYTLNSRFGEVFNLVKLRGLDATKNYKVVEINLFPDTKSEFSDQGKVFSGEYLQKVGLSISSNKALSSSLFEITAQNNK
jgi:alpha-galactosidase